MNKGIRRSFPETFKREAVERVRTSGLSIKAVAVGLGVRETVLRKWVRALSDRRRKSGHSDEVKSRDQATSEPAWAKAMPTPKKIVLPMIAPKILLPKVFMSLSINLMNGE